MAESPLNPKEAAKQLPHSAGVYRFYDTEENLLYVGKAKDLKNRVTSYFNQSRQHSRKTLKLVNQIARLEVTIVANEYDALLLENSLIKAHQPKYNILLKDDKTYPYLCLTNEPFPKLIVTRQTHKSQGELFGPYTNVKAMNILLELLRELYTIRTCHLHLSQSNIEAQKFSCCLEYHIGNCQAPCEGKQSEADYAQDIAQVRSILKGKLAPVKQHFREKMMACAEEMAFEQAEAYKQKLLRLEQFQSKSQVVNPSLGEVDVFSIIADEQQAYINFMMIRDGGIINSQNRQVRKKLEESNEDLLSVFALELRQLNQSQAPEIISNYPLEIPLEGVQNTLPKIGDKKKLLDLSLRNALFFKKEQQKKKQNQSQPKTPQALLELQQILRLDAPPQHIECFDNSNIQGTNPVASMVFFKNGRPFKSEYRHFNIKTVVGPDDFASMFEIVQRRYRRLLNEEKPLPQLIIIDGGKGQLRFACDALRSLDLYGKIPIVGIAKRLEEIYLPEDEVPLHINKKSPALKLIQHARNEAHRFAIEFHRKKRSQNSLQTQLNNIKGVGEKTVLALLSQFKSYKKISEASEQALSEVVGKAKAKLIKAYLQENKES